MAKHIMHILNNYYATTDSTRLFKDFLASIDKNDNYDQLVYSYSSDEYNHVDVIDGIKVFQMGSYVRLFNQGVSYDYSLKMEELFRTYKPSIIVFYYPNDYAMRYLLKYIPKKTKIVLCLSTPASPKAIFRVVHNHKIKKLLKRSSKVIVNTKNILELSKYKDLFSSKVEIIKPTLDLDKLNKESYIENVKKPDHTTTFIADVENYKISSVKTLLKCFANLDFDFKLVLLNSLKSKKLIEKQSYYHNIKTIDKADNNLNKELMSADFYVSTARTQGEESLYNILLANYYEKPVIALKDYFISQNDLVEDGVNGVLLEEAKPNLFNDIVKQFLDDKANYYQMSISAKDKAEGFLDSKTSEELIHIINKLN